MAFHLETIDTILILVRVDASLAASDAHLLLYRLHSLQIGK
jgi:hypothetical protein